MSSWAFFCLPERLSAFRHLHVFQRLFLLSRACSRLPEVVFILQRFIYSREALYLQTPPCLPETASAFRRCFYPAHTLSIFQKILLFSRKCLSSKVCFFLHHQNRLVRVTKIRTEIFDQALKASGVCIVRTTFVAPTDNTVTLQ
jgi:hypothetical protein